MAKIGRSGDWFEPLVTVSADDNTFDIARLLLGVMAYPEKGAGKINGSGALFTEAMWKAAVWSERKSRGLNEVRSRLGKGVGVPTIRSFEGRLHRGIVRLQRRFAVRDLLTARLMDGLVKTWDGDRSFLSVCNAMPSLSVALDRNPPFWADRLSLKESAPAPTEEAWESRKHDLIRSAIAETIPVLHLVQAIYETTSSILLRLEPESRGEAMLMALLLRHEQWAAQALEITARPAGVASVMLLAGKAEPRVEVRRKMCEKSPP